MEDLCMQKSYSPALAIRGCTTEQEMVITVREYIHEYEHDHDHDVKKNKHREEEEKASISSRSCISSVFFFFGLPHSFIA